MPDHERTGPRTTVPGRTAAALAAAAGRRDAGAVLVVGAAGYLLLYLATVGDVTLHGGPLSGVTVRTADDPAVALSSVGFSRFEAIASVDAGAVTVLLSPGNLLIGGALAALVGANLGLTYLGLVQPRACGLAASSGVLAGVPALLSGAACCGPTILLVIGVQASATLITGFQLLVPLAVAMLAGSLLLIGRQVDPALL